MTAIVAVYVCKTCFSYELNWDLKIVITWPSRTDQQRVGPIWLTLSWVINCYLKFSDHNGSITAPANLHLDCQCVREISFITLAKPALVYTSIHSTVTARYSCGDWLRLDSTCGRSSSAWQDLHDDDTTCMQSSYWELILQNGQWLGCWITDELCALLVTGWTGIHGFGYLSPLIRIAPFSSHKLIRQDTAVLHQAIIV
jgi:hypothetical protein